MKTDNSGISTPLPISSGTALILRDSRFSVSHDSLTSTFKLKIKDIQETDAGVYHCKVLLSVQNEVSASVDLLVRRPPIITANSTSSLVVGEGDDVQLECFAIGYPHPRISWRRENNAILSTGASIFRGYVLNITNVQKEDRGTYYCVAENGVGRGARRNIAVEVEFKPVITVPRPRLGQALQYDMDLECHVIAYPPPALVWMKDNVPLSNNQHYSISNFATADEYTDTTIRVITIEKRQYGKYTCKATNRLGTAEAEVELFESIIPVCPPACDLVVYGEAVKVATSTYLIVFIAMNFIWMNY
ncbi:lachesin-like isoform X2 [Ischnura elegans]|nr:lachesin-like isoform X2 [Ischnura elegans]